MLVYEVLIDWSLPVSPCNTVREPSHSIVTCVFVFVDSTESVRGFYKGLCVSMLQNIPNICIVFLMYEYVRHYFDPTQSFFAVEPPPSAPVALCDGTILSLDVPPETEDDDETVTDRLHRYTQDS